ncbi:MAG: DUF2703 domain-containing protein [Candidatus Electrothrix sp. AUS4]|nr:DUF2703 domain-containing protein [Candidatus Electrothrix sp. AUS4]
MRKDGLWEIRFTETRLEAEQIAESNMILINGRPIEAILPKAVLRETHCQSCCDLIGKGTTCCRAVELDGMLYEGIPWQVIRQAVCAVAQCC